jgi:hypothetical protein
MPLGARRWAKEGPRKETTSGTALSNQRLTGSLAGCQHLAPFDAVVSREDGEHSVFSQS